MVKVHFVQHTHWDREWYFTVEDAKTLSDQVFTEALDELERNPKANFTLDGQSSIVDEYLEINPDKLETIKKLMKEGRLSVGPWYTQTDALLVDAESILRNLIIGIRDTKEKYGAPMMLGYLPDTFGFNAQLPTLLNQVGIDTLFAWRGINFEKIVPSPYFKWKGLGDQSVNAIYFPYGYMTGLMTLDAINDIPKFTKEKLDPSVKFLQEKGNHSDILVPSGIDQKSMLLDIDEILDDINVHSDYHSVVSSYEDFAEIIRNKKDLLEYQGDLRLPVYSRVHRTISSVRTQMKLENFYLEQKIIREIEPLMVMAHELGIHISKGLLNRLWKKVLENQAHDSIGGCVSDNVAEDIFHRIKESKEIADGISNLILKRIADNLNLTDKDVLLVNTDPHAFKGKKDIHIMSHSKNIKFPNNSNATLTSEQFHPERNNIMKLISTGFDFVTEPSYYGLNINLDVEIPAMGYTVISFEDSDTPLDTHRKVHAQEIRTGNLRLSFEDNQVNLYKNDQLYIENLVELVNAANDGDTYDYSPLKGDVEFNLRFDDAHVLENINGQSLVISGNQEIPFDLEDRIVSTGKKIDAKYEITLSIDHNGLIEGSVEFENKALSHRLRLKVNVLNKDEKSIAQIQNGFVENEPKFIEENWEELTVEKPVNLEVFDKSVTVNNDNEFLTVFADGVREYERVSNNLFITLFATTGELGKSDLAWRPGRASGDTTSVGHIMMPTPLAQELGNHKVTFAIMFTKGEFSEHTIAKKAYDRLTPSISYQRQVLNKFINRLDNKIWPYQKETIQLEKEYNGFELPEELLVSSLYPSYFDKKGMVVRISNPTKNPVELPKKLLERFVVTNAIEDIVEQDLTIKAYDFVTLKEKY